jgi:hypothetical protein
MLEKAGIFNTDNESLGSICRLFSKCLGDIDLETSKNIIVGLSLYVANMKEYDAEISEINFDSILYHDIPLFEQSNFMFEYEKLGDVSPAKEAFNAEKHYTLTKNLDNVKSLTDRKIGLEMKKYAANYIHNFKNIDDLVESIFQEIAYCIHSNILTTKFTLKLPVGDNVIMVKLRSKFEKIEMIYH